ncbi:amidohydrolase family protein [Paraburkholderia kururiensis]|uniref:Amidohydrolase family protein n=1 Tax=Paraburkholderia kururiensis TaxID=984307 RepID=A0ABZ0WQ61_9BURK|nr:amidohydrolase family protein [Paraburkholderia kururiensis]WQD79502.1 amidohydrolase family protein [Paraburkholderia kururiensis]
MIVTSGAASVCGDAVPCAREPSAVTAIDAHAHVFERGLPLAAQRRYVPDYDAPLAAYLAQLDRCGVSHGVLVQPSFLGTDCSYLLAALRSEPQRLRGVAVIEPDCRFDTLAAMAEAGVVGIRLNLIGLPDAPLSTHIAPATLAHVRELGWHVEVHAEAARIERIVAPLLERGVEVVVDHFGRPAPGLGVGDPAFRRLLDMTRSRQVWVKVSAAYRNSVGDSGEAFAREALSLLKEAATVERLMWGSDWPHTQFEASASFDATFGMAQRLFSEEAERRAVLCSTAAHFYGFCEATVR